MFLQIHSLTGYSGVLLNRDDTGMAKRLPYGDAVRTRTSSQFAKRRIRLADGAHSIDNLGGVSVRSRETFKREIALPLIAEGNSEADVVNLTIELMDAVFKPSEKAKKERKDALADVKKGDRALVDLLARGEINVLSRSEIEYLKRLVAEHLALGADKGLRALQEKLKQRDFSTNLRRVGEAMSIDVAMFGRMVTGDALSSVDAAVHVAHAMTTHAQAVETDFFTAVDDLVTGDEDQGGGHLGETELTSPLLYGYYVVDWRKLLENLQGVDNTREVATAMVQNLIHLVSESVVGAKKGGTAPYSSSDLVMVELGKGQPRTLAEAFRRPVAPTLEASIGALGAYLSSKDRMYGPSQAQRFVAASTDVDGSFGEAMSLPQLASRVAAVLAEA